MKSLYFECNSGISGDMAVASLIDAGANVEKLKSVLNTVPLDGFKIEISKVKKNGIECCDFNVVLDEKYENHDHDMEYLHGHDHDEEKEFEHHHEHEHHEHHRHEHSEHHHHEHRGMKDVLEIISNTKMDEESKNLAIKIFEILGKAEAKAHGTTLNEVHFHEVGAVDSIIDIISLAVCFTDLGIKKVCVPRIYEGCGTIRCAHGILNIPVPAVSNIIETSGINLSIMNVEGEFVTPTGAAFVAAVKTDNKLPDTFKVCKIGMGAGKRTYERPSILRAFIIETDSESNYCSPDENTIIKLETNIDDSNGESLGFVMELLFEAGAREVNFIPCFMKKNRPAYFLNVICTEDKVLTLEEIIFKNTSTIGIRRTKMERDILDRKVIEVNTKWGKAFVKYCSGFGVEKCYPEYESVKKICKENNLEYLQVYNEIMEEGLRNDCK